MCSYGTRTFLIFVLNALVAVWRRHPRPYQQHHPLEGRHSREQHGEGGVLRFWSQPSRRVVVVLVLSTTKNTTTTNFVAFPAF